jgi:tripartite-type tricarboxylate transporter receptor subunit TctC
MAVIRKLGASMVAGIIAAATSPVQSQSYPVKSIRMVVGFAPGGSTDTISRLITPRLSERLGQQVVVENRGGAAGNIAAELVSKAAPDGYTLFMASASHSINASLYSKLPFDAVRDYTAVSPVTSSPFVLVVHGSIPSTSVKELIALARSKPGQLNFASGGASSHLAGELFNSMAGVKINHIPYKSSGPAAADLLGGQVAMMFSAPPAVLQHVASGRLRALGVTGGQRLAAAASIPTIAESGVPGYEVNSWSGVLGPAGLPKDVVSRLHAELTYVMGLPEIRDRLPPLGLEASTNTPEQFASYLKADVVKWAKVVKESGAKAE